MEMEQEFVQEPVVQPSNVLEYRLGELQRSMTALNKAVAGQSAQIMTLQLSLPDKYMTRLEFAEIMRQKELQQAKVDQHLILLDKKEEDQDKALFELQSQWQSRFFGVIGTAFLALVSIVIALINLIVKHT